MVMVISMQTLTSAAFGAAARYREEYPVNAVINSTYVKKRMEVLVKPHTNVMPPRKTDHLSCFRSYLYWLF